MKWTAFKNVVRRSRLFLLLDCLGLAESAYALCQVGSRIQRERNALIRQDFKRFRLESARMVAGEEEDHPRKRAWIISSLSTVCGWKLDGVLSLGLRLHGYAPMGIQVNFDPWGRRYYELFGIKHAHNFRATVSRVGAVAPAREIIQFQNSRPTIKDLLQVQYRQVDIGRIALSNVLNRHKFVSFDLDRPDMLAEVCNELIQSQRNVLAAESLIEQQRPDLALLLEKGLSPMAELFGVCVANDIQVVQYVGSQSMDQYVLKRYNLKNRHQHPFSLDPATWEQVKGMPWTTKQEVLLLKDFSDSYQKGLWFNRKFLHQGKQIKTADAVRKQLGVDPEKKTAIIFSHVLWDATFFYGEGLFDDYETWLLKSVQAACENPNVNWIVKLHPDLVWKLKYEGYIGELRDVIAMKSAIGRFPDHVKLVLPETDISTYSFFEVADYCLTVRGTIGIEMACHGVPVLTAGTGRYSNLGFTIDSKTKEEYLDRLKNIHILPPMSSHQVELARRFAYALFKLRPWPMTSFEMIKMPIEQIGHPLDHNLAPIIKSNEDLVGAPDLQAFGHWITTDQVDYIRSVIDN